MSSASELSPANRPWSLAGFHLSPARAVLLRRVPSPKMSRTLFCTRTAPLSNPNAHPPPLPPNTRPRNVHKMLYAMLV